MKPRLSHAQRKKRTMFSYEPSPVALSFLNYALRGSARGAKKLLLDRCVLSALAPRFPKLLVLLTDDERRELGL